MSWRKRPEAGSPFALRLMEWLTRILGRKLIGFLLYPVVAYFFLLRGYERQASRKYLERVYQRRVTWSEIYRHMLTFGRVTVDRLFLMSDQAYRIPMRFFNSAPLAELVEQGKSGVFLAAHFGSFEAARLIAVEHPQVSMRIVVDSQVNANFMARMAAIDPDFYRSIIDPHGSAAELGIEIAAAMRDRQWVGFLADRVFAEERTLEVTFLGEQVRIPAGPFIVAAAFKAPVIALFPVLVGSGYDVYCDVLTSSLQTTRKTRAADLQSFAQQYMDCLERYVLKAPKNWFNFYDYFDDEIDER